MIRYQQKALVSKNVRDAKLRHKYAEELLKHACEQLSQYSHEDLTEIKDYEDVKEHKEVHLLSKALVIAAEHGTVEVIRVCFQYFPETIWDETATILETAVIHRRDKVVNLLIKPSGRNWLLTNRAPDQVTKTNILPRTAELAPPAQLHSVAGSAFQLQRELQWYKETEKLVDQKFVDEEDEYRRKPWQVFLKEHESLIEKGERWMKDTSNYSMVVSTLIATVVFAAAFTVPGGQDNHGIPLLSGKKSFIVFAISDAAALFFSIVSILMFLSILTSRFEPRDLLYWFPGRLIYGLASLIFSIAAMMVAFGATLTIVFRGTRTWVATPVCLLAPLPVIMFARHRLPLFAQMVRSTFGSGFFHPQDIWQIDQKEAMQTQSCEC